MLSFFRGTNTSATNTQSSQTRGQNATASTSSVPSEPETVETYYLETFAPGKLQKRLNGLKPDWEDNYVYSHERSIRHAQAGAVFAYLYELGAQLINHGWAYHTQPTGEPTLKNYPLSDNGVISFSNQLSPSMKKQGISRHLREAYLALWDELGDHTEQESGHYNAVHIADPILAIFVMKIALDHLPAKLIAEWRQALANSVNQMTNGLSIKPLPNESVLLERAAIDILNFYIAHHADRFKDCKFSNTSNSEFQRLQQAPDRRDFLGILGTMKSFDKKHTAALIKVITFQPIALMAQEAAPTTNMLMPPANTPSANNAKNPNEELVEALVKELMGYMQERHDRIAPWSHFTAMKPQLKKISAAKMGYHLLIDSNSAEAVSLRTQLVNLLKIMLYGEEQVNTTYLTTMLSTPFADDELTALRDSTLGQVVSQDKYKAILPASFVTAERRRIQTI